MEEPLEIRLNGEPYLVTMRTPGNDIDLVRGLLYSERIITERSDIMLARYCAGSGADAVTATTAGRDPRVADPPPAAVRRNVMTTSACGSAAPPDRSGTARVPYGWTARYGLRPSWFSRHRRSCDSSSERSTVPAVCMRQGCWGSTGDGVRP